MFEYRNKAQKAIKNKNYDTAIEYALKSNEAGKMWLEIGETDTKFIEYAINCSDEDTLNFYLGYYLYPIQATYSLIHEAYRGKADKERDNAHYENALENYKTAHKYLLANNVIMKKGKGEVFSWFLRRKSWSLNDIARCYQKLQQYDTADSLYLKAIQHYRSIMEDEDNNLAKLYYNLASSFAESRDFEPSTKCYLYANSIFFKDTLDKESKEFLIDGLNAIAENYCKQDKPQDALPFLEQAEKIIRKKGHGYFFNTFYKGICAFKLNEYQKADSILKICLEHCKKNETEKAVITVNAALAYVDMALAKYNEVRKYADESAEMAEKIYGKNSLQYTECLKILASLNQITGDYSTADKQYKHVIEVYKREVNDDFKLAFLLSEYSRLELIFSNFESAKRHSDNFMSMIPDSMFILPSMTDFMNNAAYVNYCVGMYNQADTLYQKVVSINNESNLSFAPTSAAALNGLGLIEIEKKNYKKADSLFAQAIIVYTKYLPYNHPLVANVYLNWGLLQIKENKLNESEEKINKSFKINKQFFDSDHDVFANILVAQGDIAKKRGQNDAANANYQQALSIYKKKFSNTHWKIMETERKMKK